MPGILTLIKSVHYLVVFILEVSQPASYFFWRNQKLAYDIRENLHELQLIRYYQELARLKNDFVANIYY